MLEPALALELWQIVFIISTFVIGGLVKGVSGLGLPAVCLTLITLFIDLKLAMIIVAGPALATNIWQAFAGRAFFAIWKRLWSYILSAIVTVWFGMELLLGFNQFIFSALLGLFIILYALSSLSGWRPAIKPENDSWSKPFIGPFIGGINGIIAGMTGVMMMPSAAYFQATGLKKDVLVQAMGILFSLLSLSLIFNFNQNDIRILDYTELVIMSTFAGFAGMFLGQKIRNYLPERTFKKTFLIVLLLLGAFLTIKSIAIGMV